MRGARSANASRCSIRRGRGLAAAHAAGIVHRDFKPTNVLVDASGHVRVTDFGLARSAESGSAEMLESARPLTITITGDKLAGTPGYMAPEQLRDGPVTPATDQFTFCVTLWEILAGQRPYAGSDFAAVRDAVLSDRKRELPAAIPRRIRAVLLRGLASDPAARFASMAELLHELAPRRRSWIAAALAIAALAGTAAVLAMRQPASDPCRAVDQPIDAVWAAPQRTTVRATLGKIASPVIASLDARAARWRAMRIEACQASHVPSSPQSLDVRDERYACLDRGLDDLRAITRILTGPQDPTTLRNAERVAASGSDPSECTRQRALDVRKARPAAPRDRALEAAIASALALDTAGKPAEFLAQRAQLEPRVEAAADPALIADWFFHVALALVSTRDIEHARALLRRAAEAAGAGHRDDLEAHAWAQLAVLTARASDLESAANLQVMARGAAARSDRPLVPVWLALADAEVALERGDYSPAIAECRRAGALADRIADPSSIDEATSCLYDAQIAAGDHQAAAATAQSALDARRQRYGADSAYIAEGERRLASALEAAGDHAAAAEHWKRATEVTERLFGATSVPVMDILHDFALAQSPEGMTSTPAALAAAQRAVAISDRVLTPTDPRRAAMLEALAFVQGGLHDIEGSTAAYERVIQFYEKVNDPLALARTLFNCADGLREVKQCDRALPMFQRAARVAASTGQRSAMEAASLFGTGACLGQAHRGAEAEAALVPAIEQFDKLELAAFGAQTRFELAEQLVARGQRARGLAIARLAADRLVGKPPPADSLRGEITAWLAKQGSHR